MPIQLVFIRHGVAEDRSSGQADFDRRLTPDGEARLKSTLPNIKSLLNKGWKAVIWTSPLIRAMETAQIVSDVFGIGEVIGFGFIGEGYFGGFQNEIEKLDPKKRYVILVVGHEPFLGGWSESLSGRILPFKKGAAAGFLIHGNDLSTAEFKWFLQPEQMREHFSEQREDDILSNIRAGLAGYMKQIQANQEDFVNHPLDPEATHKLRVSIRKLKSLLSFIAPYQNKGQNKEEQAFFRRFLRDLSYLRELDVLAEACGTFSRENPKILSEDSDVFRVIKEEHELELDRVYLVLETEEFKNSLARIRYLVNHPVPTKKEEEDKPAGEILDERFRKMYAKFEAKGKRLGRADEDEAHALRIKAKKLRYVLELIEPISGKDYGNMKEELKTAHDRLGELCDARKNRDILEKFNDLPLSGEAHIEIRALIDRQERIVEESLAIIKL